MKYLALSVVALAAAAMLAPSLAKAEILAMVLYETKAEESIRALRLEGQVANRRDGIAILDVDPDSPRYGEILADFPLPPETVAHHTYYNPDLTKAYVTTLRLGMMYVLDLTRAPYRMRAVAIPECELQEDLAFSPLNGIWYLTCQASQNLIVGDATTDEPIKVIDMPGIYAHGIAIHEGIDRLLVTSVGNPETFSPTTAGETIVALEVRTGKVLKSYKVSTEGSETKAAPVEVVFVPDADPPVAYVTNNYGNTIWAATWDADTRDFTVQQVYDLGALDASLTVEPYLNHARDRLYVTTLVPGHFSIFDIGADLLKPRLLKSLPAAAGAHHAAITADERYAFVQNGILNLPGLNDASITVIDLRGQTVIDSITTFKDAGLAINSIALLPDWYHSMGR